MKVLVWVIRLLVGLLFIFSGLVKANDPLGLSFKMQEFFEIWGWHGFNSLTLPASVLMNAFEIIAGVAIIIGWRVRLFNSLLFIMILFFTFLTGYTYITGKPANCGCFGDCLPITSQASFFKDVILTVFILFLIWQQKHIHPLFKRGSSNIIMLLVIAFSFGFQGYALRYLPPVDCLPFKKGSSIPQKMQPPPHSVPDSFAIRFVYEKEGQTYEFSSTELPSDLSSYTYKSRIDKLVRKGNAEPAIKGFRLNDELSVDRAPEILAAPKALVLFIEDIKAQPISDWKEEYLKLQQLASGKQIPVYVVARFAAEVKPALAAIGYSDQLVLTADVVAIRTAARTNPCLYYLQNGTIIDKQGYHRWDQIFKKL